VKLAYVVPRYGLEIVGGAEYAARMFAERVVAQLGWSVEVLTSCATSYRTWENEYPAGAVEINGVTVRRFPTAHPRLPEFDAFSLRLLNNPRRTTHAEAERWIDLQGPTAPELVDAVDASDADLVIFYPYLYYPTTRGVPAARARAVMHPAAHDEAPLYLPLFRDVFRATRAFVFQTHAERRLVERLFGVADRRQIVMGLGVEEPPAHPDASALPDSIHPPYILSLGRNEDGKGTSMLARFFAEYKRRHPGPHRLVLAGPVVDEPAAHPDVIVPGRVSDEEKWALLSHADVFVSPSYFEAFSIVLMEAWTVGRPALVNGVCGPLREHALLSGGGLSFVGYAQFEAAVDRLLTDARLREQMGSAGQAYVAANFHWPQLIERYGRFLTGVASMVS
jgi:glycosyltransferase involved in cell wall biosynthesis